MKIFSIVPFVLALTACATPATKELPQQRIAFASHRDGNTDIYLANLDGSGLRRLTHDPAVDEVPRCSPDGRYIVFVREEAPDVRGLVRIDLRDGSEIRLSERQSRDFIPEWAPDSSRIYFTRHIGGFDRIAVMDVDGSKVRYLTDGTSYNDTMPGLSPDGRLLVHHTYRYGRDTELHVIDLASGESRRLTEASGRDYEATFAGSDQVVFSSNRAGGHYRLYVASIADGSVRLLADSGTDSWASRYSPASGEVLFHTGPRDRLQLLRVPLRGGTPVPVFDDGHSNFSADWCGRGAAGAE